MHAVQETLPPNVDLASPVRELIVGILKKDRKMKAHLQRGLFVSMTAKSSLAQRKSISERVRNSVRGELSNPYKRIVYE